MRSLDEGSRGVDFTDDNIIRFLEGMISDLKVDPTSGHDCVQEIQLATKEARMEDRKLGFTFQYEGPDREDTQSN